MSKKKKSKLVRRHKRVLEQIMKNAKTEYSTEAKILWKNRVVRLANIYYRKKWYLVSSYLFRIHNKRFYYLISINRRVLGYAIYDLEVRGIEIYFKPKCTTIEKNLVRKLLTTPKTISKEYHKAYMF